MKIGDQTFLDILINNVSLYGFKNIILCVGHLKDNIKRHFDYYCSDYKQTVKTVYNFDDYSIKLSEEDESLGKCFQNDNRLL